MKDAGSQTTVTVRIASSANARNEAHAVRKEHISSHRTEALARAYELSNEKSGYTTTTYTGSCISTPRSAYSRTRKLQGSQGSVGSDSGSKARSVGFSTQGDSTIRNNLANKSQVSSRNEEYNNLMVKSASKQRKSYSSSTHPRVSQIQKNKSVGNLGKRKVSSPGSQKSESSAFSENKQADTGYEGSDEYQTSQPSSSTKSLLNSPQIPSEPLMVTSAQSMDIETHAVEPSDKEDDIPEVSRSLSKISESALNIDGVSNLDTEVEAISEAETITRGNTLVDEIVEPEKKIGNADAANDFTPDATHEDKTAASMTTTSDQGENSINHIPENFKGNDLTSKQQTEQLNQNEKNSISDTDSIQNQPNVDQVASIMETGADVPEQTVDKVREEFVNVNSEIPTKQFSESESMRDPDEVDSGQGESSPHFVDEERAISKILVGAESDQTIVQLTPTGLVGSISDMPLVS